MEEKSDGSSQTDASLTITAQNYMISKQEEIKEHLIHYKKLKKRWTKIDSTFKTISVILAFLITSATAATAGITLPIVIPAVLGAVTAIQTSSCGLIALAYTSKRKMYYKEKANLIDSYLNKLFIYFERSKSDKKITLEELEEFNELVNEFKDCLDNVKNKHN